MRVVSCKSLQRPLCEVACTCAGFDDRPSFWRAERLIKFCEVTCEGGGEEWAAFGAGAIVACAPPACEVCAIVVTCALIVERGGHPVVKTQGAGAFNARAQTRGECVCFVAHACSFICSSENKRNVA